MDEQFQQWLAELLLKQQQQLTTNQGWQSGVSANAAKNLRKTTQKAIKFIRRQNQQADQRQQALRQQEAQQAAAEEAQRQTALAESQQKVKDEAALAAANAAAQSGAAQAAGTTPVAALAKTPMAPGADATAPGLSPLASAIQTANKTTGNQFYMPTGVKFGGM